MNEIKSFFTSKINGNLSFSKDNHNEVLLNRIKLSKKYKYNNDKLRHMQQIHSSNIQVINHKSDILIKNCDGLITHEKNLALMVLVADCIPILIEDKVKGVISAVHAGRNSTFLNISKLSIQKMIKQFDCKPKDIFVRMGPSIQQCCYEISEELKNIVEKSFGKEFLNGRYLNLQELNKQQCIEVGVENIEISYICTKCSNEEYYSYRAGDKVKRFAGIIINK